MEANRADYDASEQGVYGVDFYNSRLQTITPEFYKQLKEEGTSINSFGKSWNRRMAFFANAVYSYKGRYTINLTGRYDGSNQLGRSSNSRWLPTWNVSGSWNAHEEEWFRNWAMSTNNAFSHGTIRLSYSLVGEQSAASNALAVFRAGNEWRPQGSQQESAIYLTQLANSELTYEKKNEFNIGVDLGFVDNRINFVADVYWRENFDLMGYLNTQGAGGEIRKFANVASMKSKGFEATLSTHNIKSEDWNWNTDFTVAYCKTEITDLLSQSRVIDLVSTSALPRVC